MAVSALNWMLIQLEKLCRLCPELVMKALDKALQEDKELRWSFVVGAYLDKEINLGKAAELLEMHRLELQALFLEKGIPLRLGPETLEETRAEVEAWKTWVNYPD